MKPSFKEIYQYKLTKPTIVDYLLAKIFTLLKDSYFRVGEWESIKENKE